MSPATKKTSAAKKSAPKKTAAKKAGTKKPTAKKSATKGGKVALSARAMTQAINRLRDEIVAEFPKADDLAIVGIRTRGVPLAERLALALEEHYGEPIHLGMLDITLYRDDLSALGPQPMVRDSEVDFDITNRAIVLVDDVLYTGRTIRAAMDELIDFGRPRLIRLAVLVDRGGREYPIQADYVGKAIKVANNEFVQVKLDEIDGVDETVVFKKN